MASAYKIEQGIPIPRSHDRISGDALNTIKRLKPGDSFLVEDLTKAKSVQVSISQYCGTVDGRGKHFTTRTLPEGLRVWRLK